MIKKLYRILKPYIAPYRGILIVAFLLSFVLAGIAGGQLRLIQPLLDSGLSKDAQLADVLKIAGMLLGLGILNFPARFYHFTG